MKKRIWPAVKAVLGALLVLSIAMGGLVWLYWGQRTVWPHFPAKDSASLAPPVVLQVERDYGWRTGDVVPVTIYIEQRQGTEVDLNSLAITGDFEIVGRPELVTRDLQNGERLIKVVVRLQSFNVVKSWSAQATMSYEVEATHSMQLLPIPPLTLYTSPTYDGERKDLKQGPLKTVYGWDLAENIGLVLVGIVLLIGSRKLFIYLRPKPQVNRRDQRFALARAQFDVVWALILAGYTSPENYAEVERIVRQLFKLQSRTRREAEFELAMGHPYRDEILAILERCDQVLYQGQPLNDSQHEEIAKAFDKFAPRAKPTAAVSVPDANA